MFIKIKNRRFDTFIFMDVLVWWATSAHSIRSNNALDLCWPGWRSVQRNKGMWKARHPLPIPETYAALITGGSLLIEHVSTKSPSLPPVDSEAFSVAGELLGSTQVVANQMEACGHQVSKLASAVSLTILMKQTAPALPVVACYSLHACWLSKLTVPRRPPGHATFGEKETEDREAWHGRAY